MRGRAGSPEESTLLWEAPAVRKGKGHSAGSNWNDGICCRLQIHSPSHLKTPSFSPPRSVCSVMDWTVTYCGSCEVDGIHLDDETASLASASWDDDIIMASRQIRKNKSVQKGSMKLSLGAVISLIGTPADGGAMIYQPISKVIGACAHKEGGFSAKHFFSFLYIASNMHERAKGCKFHVRTFKTKNEEDATSLAFAISRTMEQHFKRGRPRQAPLSEYNVEDFENAVAWWNAGKDQMYHYTLVKSPDSNCIVTGVMNVSNESEVVISDHSQQDQGGVHGMSKKIKLPSNVFGDELVRMLGDKFNLDGVSISTHAVCEVKYNGQQDILDVDESPIARTFSWADSAEGSFVLRRLPEGHARTLLQESSPDSPPSAAVSPAAPIAPIDEATLGPQLPYCEEDEDLLLAVMISRQTGNGLGFKLTPAYLLQMCVAYTYANKGRDDINRLMSKITGCIATVIGENPSNAELLLFWCCNSMRFLEYIGARADVQQMFTAAVGTRLEGALGVGLGMLAQLAEEGAQLPAPLATKRWDTEEDLRAVIGEYYRSLDSNMSTTNLQEVIERITAAMPSAHLRQKELSGIASPRAAEKNDDGHSAEGDDEEPLKTPRPDFDPLPTEWEELVDQETKHRFFANHITRQTSWTDPRDRLTTVTLTKDGKGLGIGLSGAKRTWDDRLILGIFVSSLVQNSAASVEGTLREGDEILEVDSDSLIGVSREGAIEHLRRVPHGGTVKLLVSQEPDSWVDPDKVKASTRHTAL